MTEEEIEAVFTTVCVFLTEGEIAHLDPNTLTFISAQQL